jgi:hypothetical protein
MNVHIQIQIIMNQTFPDLIRPRKMKKEYIGSTIGLLKCIAGVAEMR